MAATQPLQPHFEPPSLLLEGVRDVLQSPVWWYSTGFARVLRWCLREMLEQSDRLGVLLWARNIFTPMFGQSDWQGRIISFVVRLGNVVVRSLALLAWSVCLAVLAAAWLVVPIPIAAQAFRQLLILLV